MRFETPTGYSFEITLAVHPDCCTLPHQFLADVALRSPRTAFTVRPHVVGRMDVLRFIVHLRAILEGLVEVDDPSDPGAGMVFPMLALRVSHVPSLHGTVAFVLSFYDCGTREEPSFDHTAFLEFTFGRDELGRHLDEFEAEVWADTSVDASG